MGTLRTIFALAVVFGHSWPGGMVFVGGKNAVQLFYVISGFLISYILVEKKAYPKIRDFYTNRYLRLYPIYFCVALLTLAALALLHFFTTKPSAFLDVYAKAPVAADVLLMVSNAILFGQDWVMFSGVENGRLVFAKAFLSSEVVLYPGLIVPQAWTLGVELTFYLIAPFVLANRKLLYGLLALSIALRIYLLSIGLGSKDPWTYRFFPTELALFLLGALSHQVLLPFYKRVLAERVDSYAKVVTGLLIVFSLLYAWMPGTIWRPVVLFSAFILLVPLTFLFQNQYRVDSWIGNLSYPIYIGHMLVVVICEFAFEQMGFENLYAQSITGVMFSIAFAVLLNNWIGEPFEAIRAKFKGAQRPSKVETVNEGGAR
jgi:peptidoglycan/LPS O-acetylase OafA/YrhL